MRDRNSIEMTTDEIEAHKARRQDALEAGTFIANVLAAHPVNVQRIILAHAAHELELRFIATERRCRAQTADRAAQQEADRHERTFQQSAKGPGSYPAVSSSPSSFRTGTKLPH